MADEIDRASEIAQARLEAQLNAIKREVSTYNDNIECIECGEEIDEDRRRAVPHAVRCFTCQKLLEKQTRVKRF